MTFDPERGYVGKTDEERQAETMATPPIARWRRRDGCWGNGHSMNGRKV